MNGRDVSVSQPGYQFGTFRGVYLPSLLTILGVVMYLRFGWVLGNVGIRGTIVIVTLASSITLLTALALSSLATNARVGAGGAYFIVSRAFGLEAGAAIGLPLYLAQALGISFYLAGFSEAVTHVWPGVSPQSVGVATLAVLGIFAYISADLALKTQYAVLAAIVVSLLSFFLGFLGGGAPENTGGAALAELPARYGFWAVFAVFFPAVTGIEAGISMSGDLKNPARSLPSGTLLAVGTGYLIYLAVPVYLCCSGVSEQALLENSLVMREVALWGDAVILGLWAASLSSAMGALLGAPRTLQALARDRVLPSIIGRSYGKQGDPRAATVVTFAVALAGILLGDLNVIAPVLSMFFLTSYGALNLAAGVESLIASPSWRPKFKAPWQINLLGALACFAVMLMINALASLISLGVTAGIYYCTARRRIVARWGDVRLGIVQTVLQHSLRLAGDLRPDSRTRKRIHVWKPNILVLSKLPNAGLPLIQFGDAVAAGSLVTVSTVITHPQVTPERIKQGREMLQARLERAGVRALVEVVQAPNVFAGMRSLATTYGFGPLKPNTILIGHGDKVADKPEFLDVLEVVMRMKRNLVLLRDYDEEIDLKKGSRIDIWRCSRSPNIGLILALAYLLTRSNGWKDARLVIKTLLPKEAQEAQIQAARQELDQLVTDGRIKAEVEVVVGESGGQWDDIRRSSVGADLVFMGLRVPRDDEDSETYREYLKRFLDDSSGFPPTATVAAGEPLDFGQMFRM
jgi:solute carrier family 12 (sodium/potassium/chloride transporter), member 2